jgi:hypothetical protein
MFDFGLFCLFCDFQAAARAHAAIAQVMELTQMMSTEISQMQELSNEITVDMSQAESVMLDSEAAEAVALKIQALGEVSNSAGNKFQQSVDLLADAVLTAVDLHNHGFLEEASDIAMSLPGPLVKLQAGLYAIQTAAKGAVKLGEFGEKIGAGMQRISSHLPESFQGPVRRAGQGLQTVSRGLVKYGGVVRFSLSSLRYQNIFPENSQKMCVFMLNRSTNMLVRLDRSLTPSTISSIRLLTRKSWQCRVVGS